MENNSNRYIISKIVNYYKSKTHARNDKQR